MIKLLLLCITLGPSLVSSQLNVPDTAPRNDVFEAFVSFSIEFSSLPDYAGNISNPNTYSDNLLENIRIISGTKPYVRVGGNTQDYALYDPSLPYALHGIVDPQRSLDYPTTVTIGPSYFESYSTWEGVKFSHGFNLALGASTESGWQTLLDTVPLACKALEGGKMYYWTYGNEPDLYAISAQGPVRDLLSWTEEAYVEQWLNGTRTIKALVEEHCPELTEDGVYGFLAPEFTMTTNPLKAPKAWAAGLNEDKSVKLFSKHNYISGADTPGVTLQGTLLNHEVTKASVDAHVSEYNSIVFSSSDSVPPLIFGETNSLYNQGRPGLSNTFGAALWVVDFNLYAASVGFKRVHMHMGTNYRVMYASWQPITTSVTPLGTKPPYYGNIFVAAALGNLLTSRATVVELPLPDSISSHPAAAAYAIYTSPAQYPSDQATLSRLVFLNLQGYNTTVDGEGLIPLEDPPERGSQTFVYILPTEVVPPGTRLRVRRLMANGSDAITGVTWDGWSYNHELDEGRPVRLGNVTTGETVVVREDGEVEVEVWDASAVMVEWGLVSRRRGRGWFGGWGWWWWWW